MPGSCALWKFANRCPAWLPVRGATFHRLGLGALHGGDYASADALFERAALRYREELEVESLARVRAHQGIARYRAQGRGDMERVLEIERQLYRLSSIESREPPVGLLDAGRMLALWSSNVTSQPAPVHARITVRPRRRA